MPLFAPSLTDDWLGKPFSHQIDQVEKWLDSSAVAVGHSFGAWLLLCAAVQQLDKGVRHPRLLLLSTLLGRGFNPKMRMGYFAPRAQRVHAALGLEGSEPELPVDELFFVHGEDDEQCPVEPIRELGELGFSVRIVPGGHRLHHPVARRMLSAALTQLSPSLPTTPPR